jgi:hypothetical protein
VVTTRSLRFTRKLPKGRSRLVLESDAGWVKRVPFTVPAKKSHKKKR